MLRVHSSQALYSEGLALQSRYRMSWYDALIVCAAQQAGCNTLYSEDLQHGQRFGSLRVVNPFL
jgi:predicted nucleic acid-binding protein